MKGWEKTILWHYYKALVGVEQLRGWNKQATQVLDFPIE